MQIAIPFFATQELQEFNIKTCSSSAICQDDT